MPTKTTVAPTQSATKDFIYAVGRRKRAIARVRLYPKSKKSKPKASDVLVNNKPIDQYFHLPQHSSKYALPLSLTHTLDRYSITIKVKGSGLKSQIDAIIHGISRALIKANPDTRPTLKKYGLLTRDPRKRQRRMIGTGGKARRQKQSPKR